MSLSWGGQGFSLWECTLTGLVPPLIQLLLRMRSRRGGAGGEPERDDDAAAEALSGGARRQHRRHAGAGGSHRRGCQPVVKVLEHDRNSRTAGLSRTAAHATAPCQCRTKWAAIPSRDGGLHELQEPRSREQNLRTRVVKAMQPRNVDNWSALLLGSSVQGVPAWGPCTQST